MLILNKPPYITSEKDNTGVSLSDILKRYNPAAMLCHRLDRETSGVIIAAKTAEAYRHISMGLERRKIAKTYHALISGAHNIEEQIANTPISKAGNNKAVVDHIKGKQAQTIIKGIEVFRHYTLVAAQPITGRFHQIRIHLAAAGHPIVADNIYGGTPIFLSDIKRKYKLSDEEEQPLMKRTALHARAIEFEFEGKDLNITAPYPKDFESTLKLLRKYDV